MKIKIISLILFLLIAIILAILLIHFSKQTFTKACIKETCFELEIASTQLERQQGLSNRQELPQNKAMLFIFQKQAQHSIWMKNMNFPLDIIWLNKEKEIIHIEQNAQPCQNSNCPSFLPSQQALYVLELNAGTAEKLNLSIDDKVELII